jgi:hypothetical protein
MLQQCNIFKGRNADSNRHAEYQNEGQEGNTHKVNKMVLGGYCAQIADSRYLARRISP